MQLHFGGGVGLAPALALTADSSARISSRARMVALVLLVLELLLQALYLRARAGVALGLAHALFFSVSRALLLARSLGRAVVTGVDASCHDQHREDCA